MGLDGDRLSRLEQDVNRILERLLEAATADDADVYSKAHADEWAAILRRVTRLEKQITALVVKHRFASESKNTDQ